MDTRVDEYIARHARYQQVLTCLRALLLEAGLIETIKWGAPTYTLDGKNLVGLAAFKSYVGLWFHQGVFLKDEAQVLVNAQADKTRGMRQWRFDDCQAIDEARVRAYIQEAIANQRAGKVVAPRKKPAIAMPGELRAALADKALAKHFDALTEGQRRDYVEYIAEAKREATRLRRIEKIKPMVIAGAGLNDRYRG